MKNTVALLSYCHLYFKSKEYINFLKPCAWLLGLADSMNKLTISPSLVFNASSLMQITYYLSKHNLWTINIYTITCNMGLDPQIGKSCIQLKNIAINFKRLALQIQNKARFEYLTFNFLLVFEYFWSSQQPVPPPKIENLHLNVIPAVIYLHWLSPCYRQSHMKNICSTAELSALQGIEWVNYSRAPCLQHRPPI